MKKQTTTFIILLMVLLMAGLLLVSCGSGTNTPKAAATSGAATSESSVSAGQALMESRCTVCHSVVRIKSAQKTADEWKTTVERMISKGAKLNSQEEQTLIDYLSANYK
jgi:hypothetical protein